MDSAGSYDPCLDDQWGYTDYGETGECSDVYLQSDMGSNREEDLSMEVEEVPQRNPSSLTKVMDSEGDEPPAPKALLRARRSRRRAPPPNDVTSYEGDEPPAPKAPPRQFGLQEDIMSDRGVQFTSWVRQELLGKLNIMVSLMSGYHPQTNGQVERAKQDLGKSLCLYCQKHSEMWCTYLSWEEYTQNSLCHAGMGLIPFECMLGYQPLPYLWNC
ncbi:hypothetical protein P4O66_003128 [Electrophorus voltai]|uniref:Integrase catalytic domain-containing protein n=1 Tax=Electrophorus voltai TaxID=2609070 RepID=A0AAD9DKJ4_9TELE|nr:hypothetical protein P4O66_003128 [Electrophorus voltai]